MAHHGSDFFDGLKNEDFEKIFSKSMPAAQADRIEEKIKDNPMLGALGATGNFPDGKLTETDEGEIMVGITTVQDRIILNFGKPVKWIGFTKEQAIYLANTLIKQSK